jgi:hypothetical protein
MSWLYPYTIDNPPEFTVGKDNRIEFSNFHNDWKEQKHWIELAMPNRVEADLPETWKMKKGLARQFWREHDKWFVTNTTDWWFVYADNSRSKNNLYIYHFRSEKDAMHFKLVWG